MAPGYSFMNINTGYIRISSLPPKKKLHRAGLSTVPWSLKETQTPCSLLFFKRQINIIDFLK